MKSTELIALSACTMMLTALGIDIMLPAFGELRSHFGLPPESTAAAQVITFFFLGQVSQLIFGILSDRYGRLSILRIGFPLYIAGGIAAAFAPTLTIMYASRFVAGMGASAVLTTTIASVRDRFVGDQMARIMSLILTIFLFTPVLAPFLGLAILTTFSWKAVFLTPPLFAVVVFLWSLRLEETLPEERRIAINGKALAKSMLLVVGNRTFVRYTTITTILFAGLSSYVASSERIVGEIYGRPDLFAWIFAGIGLLMSFFALTNSRLSQRYGAKPTLRWLLLIYTLVATLLMVYALVTTDPPPFWPFFGAVALLMAINLAVEPNSSSLALEPMGNFAGMAAAVYGTCFFFIGSSLGTILNVLMTDTVLPLITGFFLIGIITLALVWTDKRTS